MRAPFSLPKPPAPVSPATQSETDRLVWLVTLWAPILAVAFSLSEVAFEPNAFATWLGDGRAFYCAGWAATRDLDPYDLANITRCGEGLGAPILPSFFYTPLSLAMYVPLGWLPPWLAFVLLTVAQTWALIVISRFLSEGVTDQGLAFRAALAVAPSLAYGVTLNLWLGQVNLICAGLIAYAVMAMARNKDARAGLAIALAGILKPGFLVFIALPIALLRWRATASALMVLLGAFGVAFALAPPTAWTDHADLARRIVTEPLADWMRNGNHAFSGPLSRFNPDPGFIWFWHAVFVAAAALVTAIPALLAWALPRADRLLPVSACACALLFLAGPFSWWAHTPLLWLALAALAPAALRARLQWAVALLALALLAPVELNDPPIPLLDGYGTVVALSVWVLAVGLAVREAFGPARAALLRQGPSPSAAH